MAAVEVTISGMLYDKINRTTQNVVLIGEATLTGLGVGGGPIVPPQQPPVDPGYGQPVPPDMIWGGRPPPPWYPGGPGWVPKPPDPPTSIWPPGPGIDWPEHPIVLPPEDPPKPIEPGTIITWTPVWTPNRGWFVIGVPNIPHSAPSA